MAQLPTVEDVAALAGVSRQTVSNVLNTPDIVRPETRERVQTAISELGYYPHASARRLRTRQSSTIGIRLAPIVDGISGSVLDRFLHALSEQADARGLRRADDALVLVQAVGADRVELGGQLVRDGRRHAAVQSSSTLPASPPAAVANASS